MDEVAPPADQRARRNRQGNHLLQQAAERPGRQVPLFFHRGRDFSRRGGGQQEHAAIVDSGIRQRDPERQERLAAVTVVVVRAPPGRASSTPHPVRPDHRVLEIALADRALEKGSDGRRTRDGPEIVEDESEGHGPAVGAHRLDDAPHPGDPAGIENTVQPEIAIPGEAAFFTRRILLAELRRLIAHPLFLADGSERHELAPPVGIQCLFKAPLHRLGRKFGLFEKRLCGQRELLRRGAHHPADRAWANKGRRSSGRSVRKSGSKTSRCRVSFRKLTGSWYQRRA